MKAIISSKYGQPELLEIKDIPKPSPQPNEVLVKIYATAVNDYEWSKTLGKPFLYRLMFGLFKPKNGLLGMEFSGVIEEMGSEVKGFEIGDAVFGDISDFGFGSFAEYIAINNLAVFKKPANISFPEAASLPHAAMLAYQALYEYTEPQPNQRILINGAGGGVGLFALQMAKLHGAEVHGVDTGAKLSDMKEWGFDQTFDYRKVDFTKQGIQYDFILDTKSKRFPTYLLKALKKEGTYVTVGGEIKSMLQILVLKGPIQAFTKKKLSILALKPNKNLDAVLEMHANGNLRFQIDGPYPLEKAAWALRYFGEGKHSGKVILEVYSKNSLA